MLLYNQMVGNTDEAEKSEGTSSESGEESSSEDDSVSKEKENKYQNMMVSPTLIQDFC